MKDSLLRAPKSWIPERQKKQLPLLCSIPQRNPKELRVPFPPPPPFSTITDDLSDTSPCLLTAAAGDLEEVNSNHSDLPNFTPLPSVDLFSDYSEISKESITSNSLDLSDRLQKSLAVILSETAGEAGSDSTEKLSGLLLRELVEEAGRSAKIRTGSSEAADQTATHIVAAGREMAMLGFSEAVTKLTEAIGEQRQGRKSEPSRAAGTTLAFLAGAVLVVLLITMAAPGGLQIWDCSSAFYGPGPT